MLRADVELMTTFGIPVKSLRFLHFKILHCLLRLTRALIEVPRKRRDEERSSSLTVLIPNNELPVTSPMLRSINSYQVRCPQQVRKTGGTWSNIGYR